MDEHCVDRQTPANSVLSPENRVGLLERSIDYTFKSKLLLIKALRAAGATEEDYEGNRQLAQLGASLLEFLSDFIGYGAGVARSDVSQLRCRFTRVSHRAAMAKRAGLDKYIEFSPRLGSEAPSVLGKAICAIVAAVFVDSQGHTAPLHVLARLGLPIDNEDHSNSTMQSLDHPSINPSTTRLTSRDISDEDRVAAGMLDRGTMRTCKIVGTDYVGCTTSTEFQVAAGDGRDLPNPAIIQEVESGTEATISIRSNPEVRLPSQQLILDERVPRYAARSLREPQDGTINVGDARRRLYHRRSSKYSRTHFAEKEIIRMAQDQKSHRIAVDLRRSLLEREIRKCRNKNCDSPEETFFNSQIRRQIRAFDEKNCTFYETLLLYIASSESIVALRQLLHDHKTQYNIVWEPTGLIFRKDRHDRIMTLDRKIAFFQCLQRYHILSLYEESGGTHSSQKMISMGTDTFGSRASQRGNPFHNEEAAVTKAMMREIYPDIDEGAEQYHINYAHVKQLRRLGRRLHVLASAFGRGVLGLMLSTPWTDALRIDISDVAIMEPTDASFQTFVEILDKTQGHVLRQFSGAVGMILERVFSRSSSESHGFLLESISVNYISEQPKGSEGLLGTVSEPAAG